MTNCKQQARLSRLSVPAAPHDYASDTTAHHGCENHAAMPHHFLTRIKGRISDFIPNFAERYAFHTVSRTSTHETLDYETSLTIHINIMLGTVGPNADRRHRPTAPPQARRRD